MLDWIATTINSLGHWGIAFLMFLENVFPPIPSELIMPLAGFAASRGELSLWSVVLAGTLGAAEDYLRIEQIVGLISHWIWALLGAIVLGGILWRFRRRNG